MKFKIGRGSTIFLGCKFDAALGFKMGEHSVINANCRIDTRGGVLIGNNVSISNDTTILTADHDMNSSDMKGRTSEVKIDDYVWVGTGAMILAGVHIKRAAVIGARSLVTKDVEAFNVVGGIPAKHIKNRLYRDCFSYTASYIRLFQ